MIRSLIFQADAAGNIANAAQNARGFLVEPEGSYPGALPVVATLDNDAGRSFPVSSRPLYFDTPFRRMDISGATPLGTYLVTRFESKDDGVGAVRSARLRRVIPLVALAANETWGANPTPVTGNDGFPIFPGYVSFTAYLSGPGVGTNTVDIWARSTSGVWYVSETVPATEPPIIFRNIAVPGGRIFLRLGASQVLDSIDIGVET